MKQREFERFLWLILSENGICWYRHRDREL